MLVQAPYRRASLQQRWAGFRQATASLALFDGIADDWVQDGTQLLTHGGASGWRGWGARTRSADSYALSVHVAFAEEGEKWLRRFEADQARV